MDTAGHVLHAATILYARADNTTSSSTSSTADSRPPVYKLVGILLACGSGIFIGISFVLKKLGLLQANKKYNQAAGEGYGYLRNWMWWTGMTLMILGEICNFVAYAFVDAILVTPLGALSVVVTTILSAIFLKERLSFVGKIGCFSCIVGSVVIVLNAPQQSAVSKIQEMQHYVIAPGFLSYAGVIIVGSLFMAFWVGPRYGKKTMLVYLSICSWVGGLSVVATQGLGAAIVTQIGGTPQFNQWFLYVLLVFVVCTLLTEIVYLNKALNLFNAALVTPTYYVYFTSTTIISSSVLFRGFKGTADSIITVIMGFLVICSGVVLLQLAKSSKDVPDTAIFKGDLDQVRTIAEQEEPEYEPRADTIRGSGALLRAISQRRNRREMEEAKTMRSETMEPIAENETVEWDGLRRRKTVLGQNFQPGSLKRAKTIHPPLGMSKFPEDDVSDAGSDDIHPGFLPRFGRSSTRRQSRHDRTLPSPVAMTGIHVEPDNKSASQSREHVYGLPPGLRRSVDGADDISYHSPSQQIKWSNATVDSPARNSGTPPPRPPPHRESSSGHDKPPQRRTFSFQNLFARQKSDASSTLRPVTAEGGRMPSREGLSHSKLLSPHHNGTLARLNTEEERLGLVKGDSASNLPNFDSSPVASPERPLMQTRHERDGSHLRVASGRDSSDDDWQVTSTAASGRSESPAMVGRDFGVLSASDSGHNSSSPDVISPTREDLAGANTGAAGGAGGRHTPRRGYQRGRYVDSEDEDDNDFERLGPKRSDRESV